MKTPSTKSKNLPTPAEKASELVEDAVSASADVDLRAITTRVFRMEELAEAGLPDMGSDWQINEGALCSRPVSVRSQKDQRRDPVKTEANDWGEVDWDGTEDHDDGPELLAIQNHMMANHLSEDPQEAVVGLSPIAAEIYASVFEAMQPAEERCGPEGQDYVNLMQKIAQEATTRINTFVGIQREEGVSLAVQEAEPHDALQDLVLSEARMKSALEEILGGCQSRLRKGHDEGDASTARMVLKALRGDHYLPSPEDVMALHEDVFKELEAEADAKEWSMGTRLVSPEDYLSALGQKALRANDQETYDRLTGIEKAYGEAMFAETLGIGSQTKGFRLHAAGVLLPGNQRSGVNYEFRRGFRPTALPKKIVEQIQKLDAKGEDCGPLRVKDHQGLEHVGYWCAWS